MTLQDLAFSVETNCSCNERPIVLRALRDAARDFCKRSECYVAVSTFDNEPEQDLYDGAGSREGINVYRVLDVEYLVNGNAVPLREEEYELAGTNLVRVKRPHENVHSIRIKAVLSPDPGSENLPEDLVTRYYDALVYGACMRIVRQAGTPYFSPELEMSFHQLYLRELTKAIVDSEN
ncbi:MAG: hypothetical protein J6A21_03045 [Lentisphaeria bacterium]|nr:hypothetical protein [Lentisphaeria bacterium]